MFQNACRDLRPSIFGVRAMTPDVNQPGNFKMSLGSGFLIAPNIIATSAHSMRDLDSGNQHVSFQVIRSTDIGQNPVDAELIIQDPHSDVAILRVPTANFNDVVRLDGAFQNKGSMVGTLGFPLSDLTPNGAWGLIERFQHAFISAYTLHSFYGHNIMFYETDSLMYGGSSGCPAFNSEGAVIGMQSGFVNSKAGSQISISLLAPTTSVIQLAQANNIIGLNINQAEITVTVSNDN
ncbi:MAG: serine protease [Bacteroidetes bacterium]|jgi:S1-C subfamily serine protease|nr:MAG: serine protease [Bacteroidota bacterium]